MEIKKQMDQPIIVMVALVVDSMAIKAKRPELAETMAEMVEIIVVRDREQPQKNLALEHFMPEEVAVVVIRTLPQVALEEVEQDHITPLEVMDLLELEEAVEEALQMAPH